MAKRLGKKAKAVKFGLENEFTVFVSVQGASDLSFVATGIDSDGNVIVMHGERELAIADYEIGSVILG